MPSHDRARRELLKLLGVLGLGSMVSPSIMASPVSPVRTRVIPSSGEEIPLVGIGSWITFNVGDDRRARDHCTAVIDAFLDSGGRMIDSSPMYGSSQSVIGYALRKLGHPKHVFSADKVWISSGDGRDPQVDESREHWGVPRFDLLQIHNLLGWEAHIGPLMAMKERGELRYVGLTTSHGRRHAELEDVMRHHLVDFVQLTYNPIDRQAERRLLPAAKDRGMAVIVNRPFQQGALVRRLERSPLPDWAAEIGCRTWAQVVLKWIVSHPAVTCAIPATSVVAHARENMDASRGPLPDAPMRRRIAAHIEKI